MKRIIFAAALCASSALAAPAFADRWVQPVNGQLSAVMMPDGAVMMKVQVPATEFKGLDTAMTTGGGCSIEHIYPDALNTMILVCHGK